MPLSLGKIDNQLCGPNLVARAHGQQIPISLVNARLSPRSESRFRQFRFAVAPIFRLLDLVCVPEPEDIERWAALGVDRASIRQVGSIKYDPEDVPDDLAKAQTVFDELRIDRNRPVIVGGSTHAGEEEILGKIFLGLRDEFPGLFLVMAPRHAERAADVRRVLERAGLRVEQRSARLSTVSEADCLILDTTGELPTWYSAATVVFVGKSLTARGGQNPVEAILADKPVVFGPHMENFALLARALVKEKGAIQVSSAPELQKVLADLLRNSDLRMTMVNNSRRILETHRGATVRTAKLIVDLA